MLDLFLFTLTFAFLCFYYYNLCLQLWTDIIACHREHSRLWMAAEKKWTYPFPDAGQSRRYFARSMTFLPYFLITCPPQIGFFFFFFFLETLVCHFLSLLGFPNSHVPCLTSSPLSLLTYLVASRANLNLVTIMFMKYVSYFSTLQQTVVSPNFSPPVRVPFSLAPTSIFLSKATLDDHWLAVCGPSSFCLLIEPKDDCDAVIYNKKSVFGL